MVIALTADVNAASQMRRAAQDGYGSKTEVAALRQDVCFAPVSGHRQAVSACPKSANRRHRTSLTSATISAAGLICCRKFPVLYRWFVGYMMGEFGLDEASDRAAVARNSV